MISSSPYLKKIMGIFVYRGLPNMKSFPLLLIILFIISSNSYSQVIEENDINQIPIYH
jgi:hypothetical protein